MNKVILAVFLAGVLLIAGGFIYQMYTGQAPAQQPVDAQVEQQAGEVDAEPDKLDEMKETVESSIPDKLPDNSGAVQEQPKNKLEMPDFNAPSSEEFQQAHQAIVQQMDAMQEQFDAAQKQMEENRTNWQFPSMEDMQIPDLKMPEMPQMPTLNQQGGQQQAEGDATEKTE